MAGTASQGDVVWSFCAYTPNGVAPTKVVDYFRAPTLGSAFALETETNHVRAHGSVGVIKRTVIFPLAGSSLWIVTNEKPEKTLIFVVIRRVVLIG